MSSAIEIAATPAAFVVSQHPVHARLRHLTLNKDRVADFFADVADVSAQNLEYVPFMRFMVADRLARHLGQDFQDTIRSITADRNTGGFTLGLEGASDDYVDYIKFGTAIGHLLGPGNHDAMSGTYYARFVVKDTDSSDSYLRQAYRLFTMHTDGTFVDEATDWLLMMKFAEENAIGGESRLLHIDDWAERDSFVVHPLGKHPFTYKAPGSKNVETSVERPTFFENKYGLGISFIDQFAQPQTMNRQPTYMICLNPLKARPPQRRFRYQSATSWF